MNKELFVAIMTSIEALMQVPGTQLQLLEPTLRQLKQDLKDANITPPDELDSLIEEAAIARSEMIQDLIEYYYSCYPNY